MFKHFDPRDQRSPIISFYITVGETFSLVSDFSLCHIFPPSTTSLLSYIAFFFFFFMNIGEKKKRKKEENDYFYCINAF